MSYIKLLISYLAGFTAAILILCGMFQLAAATTVRKVVIINSYSQKYVWSRDCKKGFMDNINPEYELHFFDMDTNRIPQNMFEIKVRQALQLVTTVKPDIVVTMDDNALKLLGQKISDSGITVVFMGVNQNPRLYFNFKQIPRNVTGVLERPLLKRSMTELCRIMPKGRFLMMMDNSITSEAIIRNSLQGAKTVNYAGCRMDVFAAKNFTDWKDRIRALKNSRYDAVITSNYAALKDEYGNQLSTENVSEWTKENCSIPLFSFWRYDLTKREQPGIMQMAGFYQGEAAAEIVNEIFETGRIPATRTPSSEIKVYRIDKPALPTQPGSTGSTSKK